MMVEWFLLVELYERPRTFLPYFFLTIHSYILLRFPSPHLFVLFSLSPLTLSAHSPSHRTPFSLFPRLSIIAPL